MEIKVSLKQHTLLQDLGNGDTQLGLRRVLNYYVSDTRPLDIEFLEEHIAESYYLELKPTAKWGRTTLKQFYTRYQGACATNNVKPLPKSHVKRHLLSMPCVSIMYLGGNVLTVVGLEPKDSLD